MEQEIQYCSAFDGARIAFATTGDGPPLVRAANYLTHLEYDWESPVWRHWLEALSAHHTLVRYDERGSGLSDWEADDLSFEAWVNDLETVVDTLGLERFPLLVYPRVGQWLSHMPTATLKRSASSSSMVLTSLVDLNAIPARTNLRKQKQCCVR